jgi:hypothetical protein
MPWTRLANAEAAVMKFKVGLELEGIPPHACSEDTAAKIIAPSCWLQSVDQATSAKADFSAYKITAWTSDPRAIHKVVWLHIAENEIMHITAVPGFGNLPPFISRKKVLSYRVLVHLKHVTDFEPEDPTPPPSPPDPDDDEGQHDGSRDRHHFARGAAVHRIQGFPTARGIVDGDPIPNHLWGSYHRKDFQARTPPAEAAGEAGATPSSAASATTGTLMPMMEDELVSMMAARTESAADDQTFDPMIVEAATAGTPQQQPASASDASPAQETNNTAPATDSSALQTTSVAQPGRAVERTSPTQDAELQAANTGSDLPNGADRVAERDATTSQLSMQTPMRQPAVTEPAAGCAAELASPAQPLLNNADMTTGGKRAMETPTEPTRQLISTASPPSEPTPTTQEAALRLNSFVQQVQVMRPTPIIAAPPNHKEFSKVQPPVRSRRIAAQRMDHIPASKRGEVLLMRRTGLIPANVCISEDLRECLQRECLG